MIKKICITVLVFLGFAVLVFGVGALVSPEVSMPQYVTQDSLCPAVGCASGECHGFDNVPEPDGIHELNCPEAACSSADCHAWDTLVTRYYQPSDWSLNIWILAPVVLVVGLIVLVRKF